MQGYVANQTANMSGCVTNGLKPEDQDEIKELISIISRDGVKDVANILKKNPLLLNSPLSSENETALILAVKHNAIKIAKYLVEHGAKVNSEDSKQFNALDYANFDQNTALIEVLLHNDTHPLHSLLASVHWRLKTLLQQLDPNQQLKIELLQVTLKYLKSAESEYTDDAKCLNLYLTANTVFNIIARADGDLDIKNQINDFFHIRENKLQNDSSDYCYSLAAANQLCYQIAQITAPHIPPLNVLLHNAITVGRAQAWENLLLLDNDLPAAHEFFRTKHNYIHLYQGIVQRAIGQLKVGQSRVKDIWYCTDNACDLQQALEKSDLNILAQRSPGLNKLIAYTQQLEKYSLANSTTVYEHLSRLRNGLQNGDDNNTGEELEAGISAHVAVAEYADWWNTLEQTVQGSAKKNAILAVSDGLTAIIEMILSTETVRGVNYCLHSKGKKLEEVLADADVKAALNVIDETGDVRLSSDELDAWYDEIMRELETQSADIQAHNNIMQTLSECEAFIHYCSLHPEYDFFSLLNAKITLPFYSETQNPRLLPTLEIAAKKNHPEIIHYLLTYDLDESTNESLQETIIDLFKLGDFELIKLIFKYKPHVSKILILDTDLNYTIHLAVSDPNADLELLQLLCQNEKTINQTNLHGKTALEVAAKARNFAAVEFLLKKHTQFTSAQLGHTLIRLLTNKQFELAKQLLRCAPDAQQVFAYSLHRQAIHLVLEEKEPDIELVRLLLENKDEFAKSNCVHSSLSTALNSQNLPIAKLIIENALDCFSSHQVGEAIVKLFDLKQYDLVKQLITKTSDVSCDWRNDEGDNVLHLLMNSPIADLDSVKALSKNKRAVVATNGLGQTPLLLACINQKYDIVAYYLDKHIELFTKSQLGYVLNQLLTQNQIEVAKKLLDKRPDVGSDIQSDNDGDYALHLAIRAAEPDMAMIKILAKQKSAMQLMNADGLRPIELATCLQRDKVVKHFLTHCRSQFKQTEFESFKAMAANTENAKLSGCHLFFHRLKVKLIHKLPCVHTNKKKIR